MYIIVFGIFLFLTSAPVQYQSVPCRLAAAQSANKHANHTCYASLQLRLKQSSDVKCSLPLRVSRIQRRARSQHHIQTNLEVTGTRHISRGVSFRSPVEEPRGGESVSK